MVESALINTLLGCTIGAFAGLIPGTGLLVSLMIMYPYLLTLDLINLLSFYIGLANLVQFTGSVTAIHFGLPGESNSIPAVQEGHGLAKQGLGHQAIIGTSLSSLTAGLMTMILLIACMPFYEIIFSFFYKTINQLFIFTVSLLIFLFASKNKWYITLVVMVIGYFLGKIGFNEYTGEHFFTFGNLNLSTGLPILPVILGLLVMPQITKKYNFLPPEKFSLFVWQDVSLFFKNISFSMLGCMIGFVCGLVPGVSTVLATNLSHRVSKWLDQGTGPSYKSLISAEASNNSAIIVTLLPLIILGIPITGSEAMLLSIMDRNIIDINWNIVIQNNLQFYIAGSVLISLLVGLMVSWPMSGLLQKLIFKIKKHLQLVIFLILFATLLFTGHQTNQILYFLVVFFVASVLGITFKKIDVLPLIFVFLLQNKLESIAIISYNLL